MDYFLIDYENVNVSGFNGLSSLTENDTIVLFYSENADTLTFGLHKRINEAKATIQFQKVSVKTKNALDFQLCSYLGFLIRDKMNNEAEKNNYYIVSNDQGYSILPDYWKKRGIDVVVVSNLKKESVTINQPVKQSVSISQPDSNISEMEMKLKTVLTTKEDIAEAVRIVNTSKTKVEVNNNLCKKFQSKGGSIYKAIKSLIADKKSS